MQVESAKYTEDGNIIATIDGKRYQFSEPQGRIKEPFEEWLSQGNTPEPYVAPTIVKTRFSSSQYFDRFTTQEQDDIINATFNDIQVKKFYDRMWGSDFIDLEDPRTGMGIDLLISKGLLASSRKDELLEPEVMS